MKYTPEQLHDLDGKVREIGAFLGMAFDEDYIERYEDSRAWNYSSRLRGVSAESGNQLLSFHTIDERYRWTIRCVFPHNKGDLQINYTVSMAKTPEQIAKNIKSRLLPEYEKQLAEEGKNEPNTGNH